LLVATQFFKEIRNAIRGGRLAEFKAFFGQQLGNFYVPA
jgi:queuine/archaeosine tRNA-ribosyltransferase